MTQFTSQQLNSLVNSALDDLRKDRDKEILRLRGGINVPSQTLEQIGNSLNITRERVRQIEKAALIRLQNRADVKNEFTKAVTFLVRRRGGLVSLATVSQEANLDSSLEPHAIFLVKINPNLVFIERNDTYSQLIADGDSFNANSIQAVHQNLLSTVQQMGKPAKFDNIYKLIDGPHSLSTMQEMAKASNGLCELDGNWGLSTWPEVNPKSIRDKIYLVLKKTGRPIHFSEIASKIASLTTNPKNVTTQAVHNELIKDQRFVLIGRGIYALAEWGYRSGTVADIIEEVMKEENGPLAKEEIIRRVLSRRQVRTTTIILNLQEKSQFRRVAKGIYCLA
ncbi:hypothetical protein EXS66_00665 [Candidatus Saccharibacteria bacterium]|nr:hypothetical protein [Candidatus Saccharibacteria bacterium]